jgi:hypothetical protein
LEREAVGGTLHALRESEGPMNTNDPMRDMVRAILREHARAHEAEAMDYVLKRMGAYIMCLGQFVIVMQAAGGNHLVAGAFHKRDQK